MHAQNPHSMTDKNLLCLTYGTEAIVHLKVEELSWRMKHPLPEGDNNRALREENVFLEKMMASIYFVSAVIKQAMKPRYNRPREFQVEDLII